MELIVGGKGQGKLDLVLARTGISREQVCDGSNCPLDRIPDQPVVNRLHLLVRRLLEDGQDPLVYIHRLIDERPDLIVVSDEIGCGVVPVSGFEREWREAAGRACCLVACHACRVERIIAGIPIMIKGG